MNLAISAAYLLATFLGTVLVYRKFGRTGLYVWMVTATIACNIQTLKIIELCGLSTSIGNIAYGSIFLATDILSEVHGEKAARRGIVFSFLGQIVFALSMLMSLAYAPGPHDTAHGPLSAVFGYAPRVTVASLTACLIASLTDARLYQLFKRRFGRIWISNNASTAISQLIDTVVFTSLAFAGLLPIREIGEIIITMLVCKFVIAALDTPFMYLAVCNHNAGIAATARRRTSSYS